MDARVTNSDTHQDAPNMHTIVSDVRSDVANTRTAASNIHRSKLKSHGGADGQNQAVRTTRTVTEQISTVA